MMSYKDVNESSRISWPAYLRLFLSLQKASLGLLEKISSNICIIFFFLIIITQSLSPFLSILFIIFLFCVYECSTYMHICVPCVLAEVRGEHQLLWSWSNRWLLSAFQRLGTLYCPLEEESVLLTMELSLQPSQY